MLKKFELWLDESGDFFKEKEKRTANRLPSLIGGVLVPAEKVSAVLNTAMLDERNHANRLSDTDKREYVLPILKKLVHEHEVSQVFFENSKYEDAPSNRYLYLRLMAEGILQLMQKLDGLYESVDLSVWIAQRQDIHSPNPERKRIEEEEYIAALIRVMELRRKEHSILFNEDSKVHFVVRPAHTEERIQIADFACNTRLTRFSETFDIVREEVERLYDTAHIFDLHESRSENYIKICMEKGDVADAIMELFATWEPLDREGQLNYVLEAMQSNPAEENELLLAQLGTELESYLYAQEDYELGEVFLVKIEEELLPKLKGFKLPYGNFQFQLQMTLVELYIKLGNVFAAREKLEECRSSLHNVSLKVADVWKFVFKEALLCFTEGKQSKAEEMMAQACESFSNLKAFWGEDRFLAQYHANLLEEERENALSLYIYMMLSRCQESGMYQKLRKHLEEAMNQLGENSGKRERLCRYYSLLEAKAGRVENALQWLLGVDKVVDDYTFRQQCVQYLKKLQLRKDSRDIQFGVMYYLNVMNVADLKSMPYSVAMAGAFGEQQALLEYLGIKMDSQTLPNEVDTAMVSQEESQSKGYHPIEQVYSLYADYLERKGRNAEAYALYQKALGVCFARPEYLNMYLEGLRIAPKYLKCLEKMGNKDAVIYERKGLHKRVDILMRQPLDEKTKARLNELSSF